MKTIEKIVTLERLKVIVAHLKKQGKKIVTTNGAFDVLHIGHKRMLEESKTLGDVLIVGINSDSSIKQYKSTKRPIVPEAERAEMLSAFACVDYITIFVDPHPLVFLELVKPAIHTKGGEYDMEKLHETGLIRRNGGEIVKMNNIKFKSTTNIIEKVLKVYGAKSSNDSEKK